MCVSFVPKSIDNRCSRRAPDPCALRHSLRTSAAENATRRLRSSRRLRRRERTSTRSASLMWVQTSHFFFISLGFLACSLFHFSFGKCALAHRMTHPLITSFSLSLCLLSLITSFLPLIPLILSLPGPMSDKQPTAHRPRRRPPESRSDLHDTRQIRYPSEDDRCRRRRIRVRLLEAQSVLISFRKCAPMRVELCKQSKKHLIVYHSQSSSLTDTPQTLLDMIDGELRSHGFEVWQPPLGGPGVVEHQQRPELFQTPVSSTQCSTPASKHKW